MTDQQPPWWKQAAAEVWHNKWARFLAFIFFAFEIYNTAVLPAIRGTFEAMKVREDTRISKAQADAMTFRPDSNIFKPATTDDFGKPITPPSNDLTKNRFNVAPRRDLQPPE